MNSRRSQGNMLSQANSPYLIQHANNPVHWRVWGQEALDEARTENKPILLSIGYAACHWCHVMARESFESPETAALMNKYYVNIKVDREERPDIDQIYMTAIQAMGEQGGWPLTLFLTPEGIPFWGGTYFPPKEKYGKPGFREVLKTVADAYHSERNKITTNSGKLYSYLKETERRSSKLATVPSDFFQQHANRLLQLYDPVHGGIGNAPKFPNAPMLETWARAGLYGKNGKKNQLQTAFIKTIKKISSGGIYDHLAGGICRYSVDQKWLVPHFEKMLYDNAHYLRHLLWAWQLTGDDLFRKRIGETVFWLQTEMLLPQGAFASSLNSESEGEEGKYYLWNYDEGKEILGSETDLFGAHFDLTPEGNWNGNSILNRLADKPSDAMTDNRLNHLARSLYAARQTRVRPSADDKILTDWNAFLIRALTEVGVVLNKTVYRKLAATAFHFITESSDDGVTLHHSYRNGSTIKPALASDYAAMINAALSLYEASLDPGYLAHASKWLDVLEDEYSDGNNGYYLTSSRSEDLIIRPRCDRDDANPSPASQILEAMVRYANLSQNHLWLDKADKLASNTYAATIEHSNGLAGLANAIDSRNNHCHITLYCDDRAQAATFLKAIHRLPLITKTISVLPIERSFYFGRPLKPDEKKPSVIVCRQNSCSQPFTSTAKLVAYLSETLVNS